MLFENYLRAVPFFHWHSPEAQTIDQAWCSAKDSSKVWVSLSAFFWRLVRMSLPVLLLLSWACICLWGLLLLWAFLTGTMCFWASFSKCDWSYDWKLSLSQCVRAPPKSAYPRHSILMWWELFIGYLSYLWIIESYLKSIWKKLRAIWELFGSLRILQAIDHGAKQPWCNYGRPEDWLAGHIHDM